MRKGMTLGASAELKSVLDKTGLDDLGIGLMKLELGSNPRGEVSSKCESDK